MAAVALGSVLLAGCGGGAGEETAGGNGKATAEGREQSGGADGASEGEESGQEAETREVTLEVGGKGETQVYWTIGTNKSETVTLPWTKTKTLKLEGAQLEIGAVVSVIPGSVKDESGTYEAAPCVIKVDGEKVADNDEGNSPDGCRYTVK